MRALVVVLLVFAAPEQEADILHLKGGRTVRGLIVSETAREVTLQTIIKGRKGQTGGVASAKYLKKDIVRIDRMPAEARKRLLEKAQAFGERDARKYRALAKIQPKRVKFLGYEGLRTVGTHFEVYSTCDAPFVKEVTRYLDEIFAAYKSRFEIRRNAGRKIRVYLFEDRGQYTGFQIRKLGVPIENPAFFYAPGNFIAVYDWSEKDLVRRIEKEVRELEKEIKEGQRKLDAQVAEFRSKVSEARRAIRDEADRARTIIRNARVRDEWQRLRRVDEWEREQLGVIREQEDKAGREIAAFRRKIDKAIAENRDVIANNRRVRIVKNRRMFEGLFHEGFHAFAYTYLWEGADPTVVPRWLDEGLASYYEMSAVEAGDLVHGAAHPRFLEMLRDGKPVPFEDVIGGSAARFLVVHRTEADRSSLYYAQAWAIAHYMAERVPRERMEAYVTSVLSGADRKEAFETMMGKTVREVAAEVRVHVAKLK